MNISWTWNRDLWFFTYFRIPRLLVLRLGPLRIQLGKLSAVWESRVSSPLSYLSSAKFL